MPASDKKRHVVTVMRPTKALDDRGQLQGQDETIVQQWPCSIETLSGNKAEQARSLIPTATHRVEGYGNPQKPLMQKDYLKLGAKRFDVEFINDVKLNGVELSLLCTEIMLG
jgi:hypothetical protein